MGDVAEVPAPAPGCAQPPRLLHWLVSLAVCVATFLPAPAAAGQTQGQWVKERVLFGDRLGELAQRHGVSVSAIVRWNKLDKKRPRIRAGRELRIRTQLAPPPRTKVIHRVKRGDSWASIAKAYGVDRDHLRSRWNRKRKKGYLKAGESLVVWTDPPPEPEPPGPPPAATDLPIVAVPTTSMSVGRADRGRLRGGIRLPKNDALYTRRNPSQSYGSSHTLMQLQTAIARFRRDSGFAGELVINDLSRARGGRFRPHRSHRAGRDADIRLPLAAGVAPGTIPVQPEQVDWSATWALLKAFIDTGEVRYIFLSRSRQMRLHRAALRAGLSAEQLREWIEYPNHGGPALIRHARGHTKHFHIRIKCAKWETRCRD